MTKVYELPNGHRMVADIDESTRVCNITETTLDRLVSELNYYADGKADVLDKIRAEIERERSFQRAIDEYDIATGLRKALEIIDKYKVESEE